jgi:single-stranded-DNA-specific exonuclease
LADGGGFSGFLGVSRSLSGRKWRRRAACETTARAHQLKLGLSEPLARALSARGVVDGEGERYLQPTLKALFPDPSSFLDMDRAAEALIDALRRGRRIQVFADYDVDGATSAALLVRWFRSLGAEVSIYVPDRLTEGYGPSPLAFERMKAAGAELVVTVDCGAAAVDAVAHATAIGLEVVVVDHHLMREEPPRCTAVVNPNRPGCPSGQGNLAAAGVVFVLLAALNREARRRGLFDGRPEPDLRQWLDLAALGAICDVTRLTGFNRALASLGLRVMGGWKNPGLHALMQIAGGKSSADAFAAGFILGPRINAGGRIGRSDLGARLLSTDDPVEAAGLAAELHRLNDERKAVEAEVTEEAARLAERDGAHEGTSAVVVAAEGWHPGVIGIVAGRLRERWRKPVVVIALDPVAGLGKGSGRSQPGVNLGAAVQAAFEEGLLLAGGGHAMAAGLTVRAGGVDAFRAFLNERLAAEQADATAEDAVEIDAVVSCRSADRALVEAFELLQPFGPGNPEPLFAASGLRVEFAQVLNGGHIRCTLADPDGTKLKAIAWRAALTPVGEALLARSGALHVAGKLKRDDWNGRESVQLEIEDAADPRMCG